MTQEQVLDVIERHWRHRTARGSSKEERDVALVTVETLQGAREGLADMVISPLLPRLRVNHV